MTDQEETQRLLREFVQLGKEIKMELHNIRKALEAIDETIQGGFDLDWPDEEC